jgi:hypothetical protein
MMWLRKTPWGDAKYAWICQVRRENRLPSHWRQLDRLHEQWTKRHGRAPDLGFGPPPWRPDPRQVAREAWFRQRAEEQGADAFFNNYRALLAEWRAAHPRDDEPLRPDPRALARSRWIMEWFEELGEFDVRLLDELAEEWEQSHPGPYMPENPP